MQKDSERIELETAFIEKTLYPLFYDQVFGQHNEGRFHMFTKKTWETYSAKEQFDSGKFLNDLEKIKSLLLRTNIKDLCIESNRLYEDRKIWDGKNIEEWQISIRQSVNRWVEFGSNSFKMDFLVRLIDHYNIVSNNMGMGERDVILFFVFIERDEKCIVS